MKVSREGVILIKSFEGFRPRAERQADGRWVVGYGHTASAREGASVSEAEAELLLQYDLVPVVTLLNERITQPLNQHQFDALASFAVSIGTDRFAQSSVLDRVNAGHSAQAADALVLWPDDSLPDASKRRRAAERALFIANPAEPTRLADLLAAPLDIVARPASASSATDTAASPFAGEPPMPPPWTGLDDTDTTESETPAEPNAWDAPALADDMADSPTVAATESFETLSPASPFPPLEETSIAAVAVETSEAPIEATAPDASWTVETVEDTVPAQPEDITPVPSETPELQTPEPDVPALVATDGPPAPTDLEAEVPAVDAEPVVDDGGFPGLTTNAQRTESLLPQGTPEDTLSMVATPLVLTADETSDFGPIQRPTWDEATRAHRQSDDDMSAAGDDLPLDEPNLSIVRHEIPEGRSRRFEWEQTGSWLVMALSGLVACGASAAALRLASSPTVTNGDELRVIGWCLAVIALICVGVSAWNLYVRWGRGD